MATNKLFQNLNVDSKPTETVKSDVIKQSRPKKRGKYKQNNYKDTNLKINTHQRNQLMAFSLMGKALNQKDTVTYLVNQVYDSMSSAEKKQFDTFVKALDDKYSTLHHS